jgi:hypothetical protein
MISTHFLYGSEGCEGFFNTQKNYLYQVAELKRLSHSGVGEELTGSDLDRGIAIYNGRFPDPAAHGLRVLQRADLQPPAHYRLYCATVSDHWVLDPASSPDRRLPVRV